MLKLVINASSKSKSTSSNNGKIAPALSPKSSADQLAYVNKFQAGRAFTSHSRKQMMPLRDESASINLNTSLKERLSKSQGHKGETQPRVGVLKNFGISFLSNQRPFNGYKRIDEVKNCESRSMPPEITRYESLSRQQNGYLTSNKLDPTELTLNPDQHTNMKPELLNQLYKGEKARNQVLTKQVGDLKLQLAAYGEDLKEANQIRMENKEYQ